MIDFDRFWMSVTRFFGRTFKTADAPSVDWSETATMEVIAREMIDLSRLHPKGAEKEQILVRRQGSLVLFTHERTPREERFTKTTLPEPLVEAIALIQRCRPDPVYTYTLILQPAESEGIVELESERTRDGKWKNSTSHGVPICVQFESHDRSRLEALRRTLFGEKAAGRAQAQEKSQEELQKQMDALSPAEMQAAGMTMFQQMKQRLIPSGPPKPEDMPPEAAALQELLNKKLAEIEQRVRERTGGRPVNPEIQRLMGEVLKHRDDAGDKEHK